MLTSTFVIENIYLPAFHKPRFVANQAMSNEHSPNPIQTHAN